MSISSMEWSQTARKIDMVEILYYIETSNYIQFRAQHCQKYASLQKNAPNKSCSELNFVQKGRKCMSLPPPRSGARGLEKLIWLKYFVLKRKNIFNSEINTAKSMRQIKKAPNKSCSELNFV